MRVYLTPRFRSQLKKLRKTYRKVNDDVEELVSALEAGDTARCRLQGVEGREAYKVRLPNSSAGILASAAALESSIMLARSCFFVSDLVQGPGR